MNWTARWRWWLASVLMGRRPMTIRAVFVPANTPRWKRWWYRWLYRLQPASGYAPLPGTPPPVRTWPEIPDDELGVAVPMQHVMASVDEVVIVLTNCVAYTTGFQLGVGIRKKRAPGPIRYRRGPHTEPPEMSLDVGIRFSDGRESTRRGWGPGPILKDAEPAGPVIGRRSGGGGGRHWDMNFWVGPLPPDGPLTITCRWPVGGIPDGSVEVDGSAIREAGERSQKLWTD